MDIGFLANTLFQLAACPHEAYEEFKRSLRELVGRGSLTYVIIHHHDDHHHQRHRTYVIIIMVAIGAVVIIGGLIPQSSIDRRRWKSLCASGSTSAAAS